VENAGQELMVAEGDILEFQPIHAGNIDETAEMIIPDKDKKKKKKKKKKRKKTRKTQPRENESSEEEAVTSSSDSEAAVNIT
jgi:hypothetical protein